MTLKENGSQSLTAMMGIAREKEEEDTSDDVRDGLDCESSREGSSEENEVKMEVSTEDALDVLDASLSDSVIGKERCGWGGDCFRFRGGGFSDSSGWELTKALKLWSVLASGIFQGKRRRTMHMKMMATLHTSVFRGS